MKDSSEADGYETRAVHNFFDVVSSPFCKLFCMHIHHSCRTSANEEGCESDCSVLVDFSSVNALGEYICKWDKLFNLYFVVNVF